MQVLNQKKAIKLFVANGWSRGAGGKHSVKMEIDGHRPVTLPMHKGRDYGPDLTASILKSAGL